MSLPGPGHWLVPGALQSVLEAGPAPSPTLRNILCYSGGLLPWLGLDVSLIWPRAQASSLFLVLSGKNMMYGRWRSPSLCTESMFVQSFASHCRHLGKQGRLSALRLRVCSQRCVHYHYDDSMFNNQLR